ncbi:hypothetical protein [Flavobacterium fluviatile]|nr:hypothetical protein [Flavobacterium fluviatile]
MKPKALALMAATSFCAGVRHKRYSVQQESAPANNRTYYIQKPPQIAL